MKVLIFKRKSELKPIGGPKGYLYNLLCGLDEIKDKKIQVDFLPEDNGKVESIKNSKFWKFIRRFIMPIINYKKIQLMLESQYDYRELFGQYDLIHFHSTEDLYRCRDSIDNIHGKVILTSHCPKPFFMEYNDSFSRFERRIFKEKLSQIEQMDEYAFLRADYLLFPCKEAEEPYFNLWNETFTRISEIKKDSFVYVPSGIKFNYQYTRDIRKELNIPNDAFVVSYVGRHSEVKGFDLLKEIGSKLIGRNNNVYFLVAGDEAPLKGLDNERWIEIGWTNEPYAYISASDCFVLPNKQTYFDIIMLEVLAIGKPVVTTYTGGNKYFKQFNSKGIAYFNSVDNCVYVLDKYASISKKELNALGEFNSSIYKEHFNEIVFAKNYLAEYERLAMDTKKS